MDAITYKYLITFALFNKLTMHPMDVVTAYLYRILDTEIYMKAPLGLIKRVTFHIQGERDLYLRPDLQSGIRQTIPIEDVRGHILNNGPLVHNSAKGLNERKGFTRPTADQERPTAGPRRPTAKSLKHQMAPIEHILWTAEGPSVQKRDSQILALYVDDINIFGTPNLMANTIQTLKGVFQMKDLGEPNYCLRIQFEYVPNGILISQSTYMKKILK